MSMIDLFSEAVFNGQANDRLTDSDAALSDALQSPSMNSQQGELSYHVFFMLPGGAGTVADIVFKGQISNDFVVWNDIPGLTWSWLPSGGDGFGAFGVRVRTTALPKVQIASQNSLGGNRRQHMRWVASSSGGSGSWTLDYHFTSWWLHKGSVPEDGSQFNFQPGRSRFRLDFGA